MTADRTEGGPPSNETQHSVETDADTRARAESALAEIDALVNRLRRIEGQVRGLQKMIQEGKDCAAVLTQVTAAKAALDKVGMHVISHRMRECIEETSGVKLDQDSLEQAFQVFMKYAPYPMASNDSEEGSEW